MTDVLWAGASRDAPGELAPPRARSTSSSVWPLALILAIQFVVSLATLHNSAFQDEALYLYAGTRIVNHWLGGPAPLDHYATYFSGYPYAYPVIGGFLDMLGGLALARMFSLVCMLGVTSMVYVITNKLFQRPAAVFASAIFGSTGVVLFVGRLATFDALCLFLIALAAAMAVLGGGGSLWWVMATGPLLVLAIGAKYAGMLFVLPVLGLLAVVAADCLGWDAAIGRVAAAASAFVFSLVVAYVVMDKAALHAIAGSTTNRAVGLREQRMKLFTHVLQMGGLIWLIALIGLVLLMRHKGRRLLGLLLFGASWLAPVYHIYAREPVSLDKHIAYGLFFAVPLAGYALAWLSGYARQSLSTSDRGYWVAGCVAVLAVFTLGLHQSQVLYGEWANTSGLSYALHTQLRNGSGRIMAEDIEVARFDAKNVSQEWQWNSFYYPFYVTPSKQQLFGDPALIQAVKDRYYDLVELSFNYFPDKAYFLAQQMAVTRNYDLIAVIPFKNSYGKGHFFLWRSSLNPGQGNFTSVAQVQSKTWFKCTLRLCQP